VHSILPASLAQLGLIGNNVRMVARKTPATHSSIDAAEQLGIAATNRVDQLSPDSDRNRIKLHQNIPTDDTSFIDQIKNSSLYAGHSRANDPATGKHIGSTIHINPNNSREYIAHELGHHATDNTEIGHMVRNLRNNPKLAIALAAAGGGLGLPFVQSALQEGDDDAVSGMAISALLGSPVLIDEALATKNGLAIMKDAGMKATPGQRARLAGGYLSYLSGPIMAGLGGNFLGNYADDYTAVYDL